MYLIIILIIIVLIVYCYKNKEKFTLNSNYNKNLDKILKSDNDYKEIVYNSVIPDEYKSYLLNILVYIFTYLSDKSNGKFSFVPYEILEVISEDNNINVIFFANSLNGFNSLLFKANFKLVNNKLKLEDITVRDKTDNKYYGSENKNSKNVFGVDSFKIVYPNLGELINLDSIEGIKNKDISHYTKINYKINPIINPDLLRVNILPVTNLKDYFPKYPFWNDYSLPDTRLIKNKCLNLGNYYTPGMFNVKTSQKSMFSKLYDIPSFPFMTFNSSGSCTFCPN